MGEKFIKEALDFLLNIDDWFNEDFYKKLMEHSKNIELTYNRETSINYRNLALSMYDSFMRNSFDSPF